MKCSEVEILLCDYLDGTLASAAAEELERHLAGCPACREMADGATAVVKLAARTAPVEPPPWLVTQILFNLAEARQRELVRRGGFWARWFGIFFEPRFAMGMALTILSLATLARAGGLDVRQVRLKDLDPVQIWRNVDDRAHRAWTRTVKFYESLRLVYEIRSNLAELAAEAEAPAKEKSTPPTPEPPTGGKK